jgi:integrase
MANRGSKSGFGSISKLPSGKYRLRYTGPDSKRYNGRVTFSRKDDAERELSRILGSIEKGTWKRDLPPEPGEVDYRTMTLRELAKYWRDGRVTSQGQPLSPKTLHEYQRLIENTFAKFADRPIRDITRQNIETWRMGEIKKNPNQTTKVYKHLKTLFTFAEKRKWIIENPCTLERATSYTAEKKPAPTLEQVNAMLQESEGAFQAIVNLAAWGGLRKAEILALTRADLEFVNEPGGEQALFVHINKQVAWTGNQKTIRPPKSRFGYRTIAMPPRAVQPLADYVRTLPIHKEALLFEHKPGSGEYWGEHQGRPYWDKLRDLTGFTGNFHLLRAFHETMVAQSGYTNQEQMDRLGHGDIRTTMLYQRNTGRDKDLVKRLG